MFSACVLRESAFLYGHQIIEVKDSKVGIGRGKEGIVQNHRRE